MAQQANTSIQAPIEIGWNIFCAKHRKRNQQQNINKYPEK